MQQDSEARMSTLSSLSELSSTTTSGWTSGSQTPTGVGSSTARAIEGMGNVMLRGLDRIQLRVVDRRRLHTIKRYLDDDDGTKAPDESIYDDLIEFSMPDLAPIYGLKMRQEALQIMLVQIARRQTGMLLSRILHNVRNQLDQLCELLAELVSCFPQGWHGQRQQYTVSVLEHYFAACSPFEKHTIMPFLDFLLQIVQFHMIEPAISQYAMSVSEKLLPLSKPLDHPMAVLCLQSSKPRQETRPISLLTAKYSPALRKDTWVAMDDSLRARRRKKIDELVSELPKQWDPSSLPDAVMDLLNMICGTEQSFALPTIVKVFTSQSHEAWKALAEALAIIPYLEQVQVLYDMICHLDPTGQ
ncbi:hypothetical protein K435DRAFT_258564 [Dendrothele bispora CBS 962.96]|uniref:Uncharacterized protein n=1 Tax=Dendrothele bispora (strain CBS 962.96) TaxID=1314807 RepID=A0A4S8MVZ6_DENBC|nr:hypothetical protein K435DRAFT_258564 [Dendrothele bispora CBS 962.96]